MSAVEWAIGCAAILELRPDAKAITVELDSGARVHVSRETARLIFRGEVVDLDELLAGEAFGLTPLARGVDVELGRV